VEEGPYLFLSYARADGPLVARVREGLAARGWTTWLDRADIPSASDWMAEIRRGIEAPDGFVFVITPHSVQSRMCRVELSIATDLAKRLLPLWPLDRETWARDESLATAGVTSASDTQVPLELQQLDYIDVSDFLDRPDPFAALMDELASAASRDLAWLRQHTRLQQDVKRWIDTRYASSALLRGPFLLEAEQMLTFGDKDPPLTALQREFIAARRAEPGARAGSRAARQPHPSFGELVHMAERQVHRELSDAERAEFALPVQDKAPDS
jgi:hypothetical protein